jgi:hypothetical protein
LALSALSLSHLAIKNLLARSLLSTWSLLGPIFPYTIKYRNDAETGEIKTFSFIHKKS